MTEQRRSELNVIIVRALQGIVDASADREEMLSALNATANACSSLLEAADNMGLDPRNVVLVTTEEAADVVLVPPGERQ